ncbi:TPA: Wadjet anti-phage system protein JetD domain-containing protein [Klebsiella variicola]
MTEAEPLSYNALVWLKKLDHRLKAKYSEKKKTDGKIVTQVLRWCTALDLIPANSLLLPEFLFTVALLNKISDTQQRLKQANFRDDLSLKSRIESAQLSDQEIKTAGVRPQQHRVLLHLNQPLVNELGVTIEVVDTDWRNITLTQFDVLIVVENQDCFYHLALFDYSRCDFRSPLIIYRGDRAYSKGAVALKSCWLKTGKTAIYFGDFDPKGVSIAMNEGYHFMLLPSPDAVIKKSSPVMFPDAQLKFLPQLLRGEIHYHFRDYLLVLEKHQALRQQKMQGDILRVVSLLMRDFL